MTAKNIPQADESASALLGRPSKLRQRILVVEDDAMIRRLNTELLTCSGYQVDAAEDGAAAWDALQLENYDLLVTDNDMPKLSGIGLLKKLHAARMSLPVIMATGTLPQEELARHPWLQIDVALLKPYSFDELLGTVKEVLRATCAASEEIASPLNWLGQPAPIGFQI